METAVPVGVHIYRPSKRARTSFAIFGSLSFVGGIWVLWQVVTDLSNESAIRQPLMASYSMLVVSAFLLLSGVLQVRGYWKRMLVLKPQRVEVGFMYGLRAMDYEAILGRRSRATQYGRCTVLAPRKKSQREMVIKEGYLVDD